MLAIFKDCEMTITIENGCQQKYIIPLVRLSSAKDMLDWIYQIKSKSWCTAQHIIDFLSALDIACQFQFDMPAQIVFKEDAVDWSI